MRALLLALLLHGSASAGVSAADHRGTYTGAAIEWESTFVDASSPLTLAAPLPPDTEVLAGARPVRDDEGRIVALSVDGARPVVRLRQPASEGVLQLAAPLVRDDDVQRVVLTGARFEPDEALGMRPHLDSVRQAVVTREARRRADRRLGGRARPGEQPIYLVADERLADGLRGSVQIGGRRPVVAGALGLVFVAGLTGLGLLWRVMARFADAERRRAAP